MDHFEHPRNVGEIENADGIGEVGNPTCGDIMRIYLKIKLQLWQKSVCGFVIVSSPGGLILNS